MSSLLRFEHWTKSSPMGAETEVGDLLYGIVRMTKPLICLETGTAEGDTAECIGQALADNGIGVLHTCEIDEGAFQRSSERLKDLPVRVHQMKGIDLIQQLEGLDFVFIDSWWLPVRTEEALAVHPKVNPRGLVCLHDVNQNYAAVSEAFQSASGWPNVIFDGPYGLSLFQAPDDGARLSLRGREIVFR